MTPAQIQQRHLEEVRIQDLARRQARKPTDKEIPDELAEVIVGDGVANYKRLREVEQRLDAVMMRKRLDVKDNLQRNYARREGVMRVWVSNTAEGQPWQVAEEGGGVGEDGMFEFGESGQATFRVQIEGRLLEDLEDGAATEGGVQKPSPEKRPRLSHFFKAITIDFHRNPALQPDGYSQIEWRKPNTVTADASERDFDTLEFERKGDENIDVTIKFFRDDKNKRFKCSAALAELLDSEEEDVAGAVQGIWEYVRAEGLQEDEDRRSIVCDEPLRKLFNKESIYFPYLPDLLMPHLLPLPPIEIPYTIRVDEAYIAPSASAPSKSTTPTAAPANAMETTNEVDPINQNLVEDLFGDDTTPSPAASLDQLTNPQATSTPSPSAKRTYDIPLPILSTPSPHLHTLLTTSPTHLQTLHQITAHDDTLALLIQNLNNTNAKRKFHENLSRDPANFLKRWVGSQRRDLEVILAEQSLGGEGDGGGLRGLGYRGVWEGEGAREGVGGWLARVK